MRRLLVMSVALAVAMFAPAAAAMRGGGGHGMHGGVARGGMPGAGRGFAGPRGAAPGWHGPWRHGHPHSHVFFGFGFPFFADPFFYPYYVPYPAYAYPPPPPPEEPGYEEPSTEAPGAEAPPVEEEQPEAEDAERASYGLVQLKGVPEGASVDLDGRFWLKAERLESRWLALPRGPHTLTVHVEGHEPAERRVDVESGKTQVVRFGPFERTA